MDLSEKTLRPDGEERGLSNLLAMAVVCIRGLGEGYAHLAGDLHELQERLGEGRFHLAVLGQFKRGKSTLLNALLGQPVLPAAVVPLTAIPTFVRPGGTPACRIHFVDRREPLEEAFGTAEELRAFLAGYVTEKGNPQNTRGVAQVEVFHPAELLARGVVLIDTPGIGSTLRHNTEATLNFLPQCDAAMFLVSADPPITEVEVEFLRQVRSKVGRLFFILNKVDYLEAEDREASLGFLQKVLEEHVGLPAGAHVFCVSARQGLAARMQGDEALHAASGLAAVEHHLVQFLACEKAAALREAVARKAADLIGECLMRLRLALRSLRMPLEELQERLLIFEAAIEEVRRQRIAAGDLLAGDRRRMHAFLEEQAAGLRAQAREYLGALVHETLARDGEADEEKVREALAGAIPGYFEHQVGQVTELFRRRMEETLQPHQQRGDTLIESVRKTAAELFDVPYHAPESAGAFQMVRRPHWITRKWTSVLGPIATGLIDRLVPVAARRERTRKRLLEKAAELVVPNVENLRWAMFQSIDHTFLRFGSALDRRLGETLEATHGAVRAAMERRRSEGETVAPRTAQLETTIAELERLRSGIGSG